MADDLWIDIYLHNALLFWLFYKFQFQTIYWTLPDDQWDCRQHPEATI